MRMAGKQGLGGGGGGSQTLLKQPREDPRLLGVKTVR